MQQIICTIRDDGNVCDINGQCFAVLNKYYDDLKLKYDEATGMLEKATKMLQDNNIIEKPKTQEEINKELQNSISNINETMQKILERIGNEPNTNTEVCRSESNDLFKQGETN